MKSQAEIRLRRLHADDMSEAPSSIARRSMTACPGSMRRHA
jgi:hypothetical protein